MKPLSYATFALLLCFWGCGTLDQDWRAKEAARSEGADETEVCARRKQDFTAALRVGKWCLGWQSGSQLYRPSEASRILCAQRGGSCIELRSPGEATDLPGFKLTSPEQALQFARLFTSHNSYHRFVEPRAFEFPDSSAHVSRKGGVFTINRKLVFRGESQPFNLDLSSGESFPVYQVQETLCSDGTYKCEKVRLVRWVPIRDLDLPFLE
jgi:hypothetical protein